MPIFQKIIPRVLIIPLLERFQEEGTLSSCTICISACHSCDQQRVYLTLNTVNKQNFPAVALSLLGVP